MGRKKVASPRYGPVREVCIIQACADCIASGTALHSLHALEHPRWEDYTYEYLDPVPNRFYWLGDGQTYAEKTMTGDRVCSQMFVPIARADMQ